jgi:hypothetical protein
MKRGVNYIFKKLYHFVGEFFLGQDGTAFKSSLFSTRQPVSFMNVFTGNGERHFESYYAWVNNLNCLESKSPIIYSRRLGSGDRLQQ